MLQADLSINLAHFDERLDRFGAEDPQAVSWNSRDSQVSRFAVLAQVGSLEGCRILDVGCGLGDFYGYVQAEAIAVGEYQGIDINPRMIAAARAKYPGVAFEYRDLRENPFPASSFDWVLESGIFNLDMPHWHDVAYGTLRAMFEVCRRGVAANFLSRLSGNSVAGRRYTDPAEIAAVVGESITRKYVLRHDYRSNDFTIFLYR